MALLESAAVVYMRQLSPTAEVELKIVPVTDLAEYVVNIAND